MSKVLKGNKTVTQILYSAKSIFQELRVCQFIEGNSEEHTSSRSNIIPNGKSEMQEEIKSKKKVVNAWVNINKSKLHKTITTPC